MVAVDAIVERLLDVSRSATPEAGAVALDILSDGRLTPAEFLADPLTLIGFPYFVPRYVAQVTLRALQGNYDSVDDMIASLQVLGERFVPLLEPGLRTAVDRVAIPEAKVLALKGPARNADGHWESSIEGLVTSGPLRGAEIRIRLSSRESYVSCLLVSCLWQHATIAVYNLIAVDDLVFSGCAETFIVVEPMRQVNATMVARSLHCTKPQLDQMRRGRGDVTTHTLKGIFIHSLFDRLLEGDGDIDTLYDDVFPQTIVPLASIADESFDERAFRADVLRHAGALKTFIDANPNLRRRTELELKRYSATIGIQGRIDAVFRDENRLDILELKTGARIRPEDHAQLFIYRLLMSDLIRRWGRAGGKQVEITARLLSSTDGSFTPLEIQSDFLRVIDARNRLLATRRALGLDSPHFRFRYEGFNKDVCGGCVSWTRKRCKETSELFGDRPDSPPSAELEYFRRFTKLIELERWSAERDVVDLLDDSSIEARKNSFRTLTGARIVAGANPFTFEFDENTSDIANGDSVLIHSGNISSATTFHGRVRSMESSRIRVSIPLMNLTAGAFEGQDWIIDRLPLDVTSESSQTALFDFLVSPMDAKKQVVLGKTPLSGTGTRPEFHFPESEMFLNSSQIEAIERSVNCDVFHLIWGPPGTGKTRVIPGIVRGVDGPALLGAFTNTAVDKMLISLLNEDPSVKFLRMGRASESPEVRALLDDPAEYFSEDLALKYRSVKAVQTALRSVRIVAATAHRACTLPYLRQRAFDMVVVDEAGQLTEPLTLGLILRGRRFTLIGDDRQLPPVVRTRGLMTSLFERLKSSAEQSDGASLTLLDTQYRMHPGIMEVSNRLFYEGRLKAGVAAEDRMPPAGPPVVFLPVEDSPSGSEIRNNRRNLAEAETIRDLVQGYVRDRGVAPQSIGVVSPFRAQVALLRQLIGETGVTIDTVERFQGSERDVMILSFVRAQGTGFVFDERRFNVAITRARRKLILVAHPNLFRNSRYDWISSFTEASDSKATHAGPC